MGLVYADIEIINGFELEISRRKALLDQKNFELFRP